MITNSFCRETIDGHDVIIRPYDNAGESGNRNLAQENQKNDAVIDQRLDFVAVAHRNSDQQTIGVGHLSTDIDNMAKNLSITVANQWQDRGLEAVLSHSLREFAKERCAKWRNRSNNRLNRQLAVQLGSVADPVAKDVQLVLYQLPPHIQKSAVTSIA
ncbi:MAG: hypothetical protein ACI92E_002796 [Oceanicoccus sp.]|jgi:hypothetical protein